MSIVTKIFGTGKKAEALDSLQSVDAALTRLRAERHAAEDVIAAASSRRRELLIADAPDKAISALDAETDAASLALDRLDVIEPQLIARRAELLDVERRALLSTLESNIRTAEGALDKALAGALDAFDSYMQIVHQFDAAGFAGAAHVARPPLVGEGILVGAMALENWRRERERLADAKAAALMPFVAPTPARAKVVPLRRREIDHGDPRAVVRPTPRAPRKLTGPIERNMVRVEAIMNNADFAGMQSVIGDQHDVTREEADYVLRGSAFRFVASAEIVEDAAQ